jgi:hypothetical protein
MDYHDSVDISPGRLLRQTIFSILVILLAIMLCSIVSVLAIDELCHSEIDRTLPLYPQAELVSQQHEFLRPRAMGRTYVVLATTDLAADVSQWYRDHRLKLATRGEDASGRNLSPNGLASVSYRVSQDAVTGQTLIYLVSECAYN